MKQSRAGLEPGATESESFRANLAFIEDWIKSRCPQRRLQKARQALHQIRLAIGRDTKSTMAMKIAAKSLSDALVHGKADRFIISPPWQRLQIACLDKTNTEPGRPIPTPSATTLS